MKYQQAEGITELFWQKMRNPLTFWPRVILTLLILIAFWSHSVWWIIFLLFLEGAILIFAPPASNFDSTIPRIVDGWRIWCAVRSPLEHNAMFLQLTFGGIALLSAIWLHCWFWILFFAIQVIGGKLMLCLRFLAMANRAEYDVQVGLTKADLVELTSRCDITN